jgi:hypothetical protein
VRGQHHLGSQQVKASEWSDLSLVSQSGSGLPLELCLGLRLELEWPLLPASRPESWALSSVQELESWTAAHWMG